MLGAKRTSAVGRGVRSEASGPEPHPSFIEGFGEAAPRDGNGKVERAGETRTTALAARGESLKLAVLLDPRCDDLAHQWRRHPGATIGGVLIKQTPAC